MRRAILLLALLAACAAEKSDAGDDFVDPYMDEPLPPICRDTSTGPCEDTTAGEVAVCDNSDACPTGQVCAASFDGDIGTFRCEASCIATNDGARWCFDDAACCDATATCVRGLCLAAE